MDAMVKEGRLEWDSPAKTTAIVYWRTPDEWATLLYDWVDSTAQRGSILTLYEIVEGDATANQGELAGNVDGAGGTGLMLPARVPWYRYGHTEEGAGSSDQEGAGTHAGERGRGGRQVLLSGW